MLITVYEGASLEIAEARGAMHFNTLPSRGDEVLIDRTTFVVDRAWHRPSEAYYGAKLGILITEKVVEPAAPRTPTLASVA